MHASGPEARQGLAVITILLRDADSAPAACVAADLPAWQGGRRSVQIAVIGAAADARSCQRADDKTMPGVTRRVIVLTAWAVHVEPDLAALVVDLGLSGLPDVVGIDTVRIVIPRLKVPPIFKSRPHAAQPSAVADPGRTAGREHDADLYPDWLSKPSQGYDHL